MDLTVEKFIDGFFKEGTVEIPPDTRRPKVQEFELPPWFDENKFNQGRRFFRDHRFSVPLQKTFGLIAVFSVPTILRVLVGSHRSSSVYTAYKRYMATFMLINSWYEYEMKPGSVSWRSLQVVRMRHFKSSQLSKVKGVGVVSQRDMAITMFGLCAYPLIHPEKIGIRELQSGDYDAFNHVWRVIGYMLGLEDRFNPCRENVEDTKQIFEIIEKRVYIPCLENVPEYFEHMSRVFITGIWNVIVLSNNSLLWSSRWMAGVPGYVYYEHERLAFRKLLKEKLKGRPLNAPVDSAELMERCAVEGLAEAPPRYFFLKDYDTLDSVPNYKRLTCFEKLMLHINMFIFYLINFSFFRTLVNLYFDFAYFLIKHMPWFATIKFGFKAFCNMFYEPPTDNIEPLSNEVFFNKEKNNEETVLALKNAGLTL